MLVQSLKDLLVYLKDLMLRLQLVKLITIQLYSNSVLVTFIGDHTKQQDLLQLVLLPMVTSDKLLLAVGLTYYVHLVVLLTILLVQQHLDLRTTQLGTIV